MFSGPDLHARLADAERRHVDLRAARARHADELRRRISVGRAGGFEGVDHRGVDTSRTGGRRLYAGAERHGYEVALPMSA